MGPFSLRGLWPAARCDPEQDNGAAGSIADISSKESSSLRSKCSAGSWRYSSLSNESQGQTKKTVAERCAGQSQQTCPGVLSFFRQSSTFPAWDASAWQHRSQGIPIEKRLAHKLQCSSEASADSCANAGLRGQRIPSTLSAARKQKRDNLDSSSWLDLSWLD